LLVNFCDVPSGTAPNFVPFVVGDLKGCQHHADLEPHKMSSTIKSAPITRHRSPLQHGRRASASDRWRIVGWILALTFVTVGITQDVRPSAAATEPTPPGTAFSYYVRTTDPGRLLRLGCQEGRRMKSLTSLRDTIVVLDFGRPVRRRHHHRGPWHYGVSLFKTRGFAPVGSVLLASEAYAQGVWNCSRELTRGHIRIAIGTTNWGRDVTWWHGRMWAAMVNTANAWVHDHRMNSRLDFAGANDIELSWNSPWVTRNWVRGYESLANHPYYNYGSADACPPRGRCAGAWTLEDVWFVSWGAPHAWPLPEIYTPNRSMAQQWYRVAVYSYLHHGVTMRIAGVMSQRGACRVTGDPCRGMNNTPDTAWRQLYRLLNRDPRTRQHIQWATDIR
jgi:hypothetical protein